MDRTVMCGPFASASDRKPDGPAAEYVCELDVILAHPDVEQVGYDIDVDYPGANSPRNRNLILACSSDGEAAACDG